MLKAVLLQKNQSPAYANRYCLGATAHFVGVTYRLAVVAVGIATAAYAYYFLGSGLTPPWGLLAHF